MKIVDASDYLAQVRALITEYTQALGRDLRFQHLSEELEYLSQKYLPPNGRLLAAQDDQGEIVGCVAFRRLSAERCEMKRLYVKPASRKAKAGRALVATITDLARQEGYGEMVLDTLGPMVSARALYRSFGFEEMEPYYDNPMDDVLYLRLKL